MVLMWITFTSAVVQDEELVEVAVEEEEAIKKKNLESIPAFLMITTTYKSPTVMGLRLTQH